MVIEILRKGQTIRIGDLSVSIEDDQLIIRGENVDNIVDNHVDDEECKARLRKLLGEK